MTITRVVQDGVEFFTIDATGESGASLSGAAKLAGVRRQSLTTLIQNVAAGKTRSKCLKPFLGKDLRVQFSFERIESYTQIVWLPSDFLAALLEYYAYESPRKTPKALFAFRKFARMGIDRWIQSITGWVDPSLQPPETTAPAPLPDLKIPRQALDILKNPNVLSANGYRLYLQLHEAEILNRRPSAADICRDLDITLPTYYKALNLLEQFGILPTWIVTKRRRQPERVVRDWLQRKIGGQAEAASPDGPIDLLTEEEVVEVKAFQNWKEGIGHVLVKAQNYPDRHKCLLLFGERNQNIEHIQKRCDEFGIQLGFIAIRYTYDSDTEEINIQLLE